MNEKSKLHQTWRKYQLYHKLLLETNFAVKFYLEARYWKKLGSGKKVYKIL